MKRILLILLFLLFLILLLPVDIYNNDLVTEYVIKTQGFIYNTIGCDSLETVMRDGWNKGVEIYKELIR